MDLLQAFILGIVQGVTEFLPISSSAHLELVSYLFGWQSQGIAFKAIVHLATLISIIFYFFSDIKEIIISWNEKYIKKSVNYSQTYVQLGHLIIVATIPICIIGFFFNETIEQHFHNTTFMAINLFIFGIILGIADKYSSREKLVQSLTYREAIIIGLAQILALFPAVSRSGITITAALILGYKRRDAAEFSFLISIPTILLASLLQIIKLFSSQTDINFSVLFIGFITSTIVSFLSVHILMKALRIISFNFFAIYRVILALILFFIFGFSI